MEESVQCGAQLAFRQEDYLNFDNRVGSNKSVMVGRNLNIYNRATRLFGTLDYVLKNDDIIYGQPLSKGAREIRNDTPRILDAMIRIFFKDLQSLFSLF